MLARFEKSPQQMGGTMVNRLGLLIAATLMIAFSGAPVRAEGFQEGFGGIPWGASVDAVAAMQKVGANEPVVYYVHPDRGFTFEGVEIRQVIYGFYQGRFFAAYLQIDTLEVFQQLKQKLQSRYGAPLVRYAAEGRPAVYRWKEDNLKIKLKVDGAGRKMKLALYYVPLTTKVNEESQERYQEQGLRFLPIRPDRTPEMLPLLEF